MIFALQGLYAVRPTRAFWKEFLTILFSVSVGIALLIIVVFLQPEWFSSRFVILTAWALAILFITIARYSINFVQKLLLVYKGFGVYKVALIGKGNFCSVANENFRERPELGYKVVAQEPKVDIENLRETFSRKHIDEVLVCDPNVAMAELRTLSDFCHRNRIELKFVPAILQSVSTNFEIKMLFDEPLIVIKNTPLEGWGKIIKRIFDILGSFVGLVAASPLLALTALAIKLDSRGPIVFKNERRGHEGPFDLYKFRYMKLDFCTSHQNPNQKSALELEEELIKKQSVRSGPLYKIKNDPRKTRVGRIIEALSIDELPQLWNVLKGDMSLVGPRPHQPREVERYEIWQKRTLSIKPGITGLAQISGRSDISFSDEARLDIFYIENWSLWLDLQIIFKTFFVLWNKRKNL